MDEIELIKARMKHKSNLPAKDIKFKNNILFNTIRNSMICTLLFLLTLIVTKTSDEKKIFLYKNIYDNTFSFSKINSLYKKYFGNILPFENLIKDDAVKPVFNETFTYKDASAYLDGALVKVEKDYLVPLIESGLVVFIGDKEGYGNTVIIQQINGIDLWYSNITNINVKIYDYVEKGNLLAETSGEELYLVYKKDGTVLDYKEHLK